MPRGWPIPIGGTQAITDALLADPSSRTAERSRLGVEVAPLGRYLPPAKTVMLDVTPRALLAPGRRSSPPGYRRALERFRYGNGIAKLDFALSDSGALADARLRRAGTVHVSGTRADIARAEHEVAHGRHPESPYVLVSRLTVFDPRGLPAGRRPRCGPATHVPAGSRVDRAEAVVRLIERFSRPGSGDTILATSSMDAVAVEDHNLELHRR